MNNKAPIGIFDSGIGGLTVARAITELLPNENIIYFGDTAHLPYGDKSAAFIQARAIRITNLLLELKVKAIVVACNSASAAAYELICEYVSKKCLIINVIDPMVNYACAHFAGQNVGLIGTRQTVQSKVYEQKIFGSGASIVLKSLATPLLAPMIEEGFVHNNISKSVFEQYLSDPILANIDALLLACTHYPLIRDDLQSYYGPKVKVIDGSACVAEHLRASLAAADILNQDANAGQKVFYVSDFTQSFQATTRLFFGRQVHLQRYAAD